VVLANPDMGWVLYENYPLDQGPGSPTLSELPKESFPEASAGHAVEHFLQFGAPAEALALARRSAAARGDGDTQIALCAALYRAGRAGEAGACITRVQESGWDTPQLHAMAATIFASLGRNAEADAARAKALARNRYAMRLYPVTPPVQSEMVSML